MKVKGKYRRAKNELKQAGIKPSNLPWVLYLQLAKLKGYKFPEKHVPDVHQAKKALGVYSNTGILQQLPIHLHYKAKKQSQPREKPPKPLLKGKAYHEASLEFLNSSEWKKLRYQILVKRGARCECCGATANDGIKIHVDHIKPRYFYPALALDENNLQVLCEDCNHGKGAWDDTDWRKEYQSAIDRDAC